MKKFVITNGTEYLTLKGSFNGSLDDARLFNRKSDASNSLNKCSPEHFYVKEINLGVQETQTQNPTSPVSTPVVPRPKDIVTNLCLVLDGSSSMANEADTLTREANKLINQTFEEAKKNGHFVNCSVVVFSDRAIVVRSSINKGDLTRYECHPGGWTALFDGIWKGVESLENFPISLDNDNAYLVYILTDGAENKSKRNISDTIALIKNRTEKGNWTFAIQCPFGHKEQVKNLGIPLGNISEWDGKNVDQAMSVTSASVTNYSNSRSSGKSAVQSFYTDLSGVSSKDLTKLNNLSDSFQVLDVPKESVIKDFVEKKTKKPYNIGDAFYLLQKRELVQATKEVLVQDKATGKIFGGNEARKLIGLPQENANVEPFDHSHFNVFVASTSVNRILPRGTKLAVKK